MLELFGPLLLRSTIGTLPVINWFAYFQKVMSISSAPWMLVEKGERENTGLSTSRAEPDQGQVRAEKRIRVRLGFETQQCKHGSTLVLLCIKALFCLYVSVSKTKFSTSFNASTLRTHQLLSLSPYSVLVFLSLYCQSYSIKLSYCQYSI